MTILHKVAELVLNTPLLITPQKANIVLGVLSGRLPGIEGNRFVGSTIERDATGRPVARLPYRVQDGVGIITIDGSLVNRGAWLEADSGLVSYEGLQFQLAAAAADPKVRSIILDMNSPGGTAAGLWNLTDTVRAIRKEKRVVALVNHMACSAAYAIAAQATEIVTIDTGMSGSIGVVMIHQDFSKALEREGVSQTLIFAGDHKLDGNPFEPLPADVREKWQQSVDACYSRFVQTVGKGRGERLNTEAARATKAEVYAGADAVAAGLADRVGTFESVLTDLTRANKAARSPNAQKGVSMSENMGAPAADAGFTQADLDRARGEGKAEGMKDGGTAERGRIAAILALPEAKGREEQAQMFALETDMTADQVAKLLGKSPSAALRSFEERRMNNPVNGHVSPNGDAGATSPAKIDTKAIYGRLNGRA